MTEKSKLRRTISKWASTTDQHARDLAPVVADIRAGGATSLRAIAAEMNDRGMLTRRGGRWHVSTVMNCSTGSVCGRRHTAVPADVARGGNRQRGC